MIQKMADYLGVTPKVLIIGIIGFIIAAIIIYIKISIDEKKGVNSQEKADIRKIISNLIPDGGQYMAAYAHSKEVGGSRGLPQVCKRISGECKFRFGSGQKGTCAKKIKNTVKGE